MTPISVLCIGYLLAGLSATASQGHYPEVVNSVSMRPVDSGLSRVLWFNQGTFLQYIEHYLFNGAFCANSII